METKWVDKFLSKPTSKIFVRVDDEFFASSFNCYGLKEKVPNFQQAFDLIHKSIESKPATEDKKDSYSESASCSESNINSSEIIENQEDQSIEKSAQDLYGLIHSRFILKDRGLQLAFEKYQNGDYPECPRYYCKSRLLPFGEDEEELGQDVRWYCPACNDVYALDRIYEDPKDFLDYSFLDGGYFGPSWIYLFRQKYASAILPKKPSKVYVPRIFGFKIFKPEDSDSDSESG